MAMATHRLIQGKWLAFRGLSPSRSQTLGKTIIYVAIRDGCPSLPSLPAYNPSSHPPTELQGLGSEYSALILQNLGSR